MCVSWYLNPNPVLQYSLWVFIYFSPITSLFFLYSSLTAIDYGKVLADANIRVCSRYSHNAQDINNLGIEFLTLKFQKELLGMFFSPVTIQSLLGAAAILPAYKVVLVEENL